MQRPYKGKIQGKVLRGIWDLFLLSHNLTNYAHHIGKNSVKSVNIGKTCLKLFYPQDLLLVVNVVITQ